MVMKWSKRINLTFKIKLYVKFKCFTNIWIFSLIEEYDKLTRIEHYNG